MVGERLQKDDLLTFPIAKGNACYKAVQNGLAVPLRSFLSCCKKEESHIPKMSNENPGIFHYLLPEVPWDVAEQFSKVLPVDSLL